MSECPEHVRQIVNAYGIRDTVRHLLTAAKERKAKASSACTDYDADERDHFTLSDASQEVEALEACCAKINR